MDDNPEQTKTSQKPEQSGPSLGERAADVGRGIKDAAKTAKSIAGDAAAGGVGGGAGGLGKIADSLKGLNSGGKSMDGIKDAGGVNKTPSMFKGMEGSNKPHDANNPASEKSKNPGVADFAKKVGSTAAQNSKTGQKVQQAANDAVETAKDAKDVARLVGTGGADATAWADFAKRIATHPVEFTKRYGRVGLYIFGFFFMQAMIVVAVFAVIFFGIYKVALSVKQAAEDANPISFALELGVNGEMSQFLADSASQLVYERQLAQAGDRGVVVAQADRSNYDLSSVQLSDTARDMHETWASAGLAEKFVDEYKARIEPNGTARQVDSFDPSAWNLYVGDRFVGNLDSQRAQAFIGIFTEETTQWKDIYQRKSLQAAAKKKFDVDKFKLDLPDSNRDMSTADQNVGKQLIQSTLKPIDKKADTYHLCFIEGADACAGLGLGSTDVPSNADTESRYGGFFGAIISSIRNARVEERLKQKTGVDKLKELSTTKPQEVDPASLDYSRKEVLDANIRTASSDAILSSIDRDPADQTIPDPDLLLDMYDKFEIALDNGNYSRVNYDRTSSQSVASAYNYFNAGGQLLNQELGVIDSWAFTKNLSILEESSVFKQAVLGNPVGVFAKSSGETSGLNKCQSVYNDEGVVGKAKGELDRPVTEASCFKESLVPDVNEFKQSKSLNKIYGLIEEKNDVLASSESGSFSSLINLAVKTILNQRKAQLTNGEIRTSPVVASSFDLDSYGPEFDAYTNKVYGVAKTGAEINGDAYDTMYIAAESLWTAASADPEIGVGGRYLTDEEVADTMRLAQQYEQAKYAYKPLGERLFSLKDTDSLTAKLAMLTPTNRGDTAKKTLALLNPDNLTSPIAARLTPSALASSIGDPNPVRNPRIGYTTSDAAVRKSITQTETENDCQSGGPEQQLGVPSGQVYNMPTTTNPCKYTQRISTFSTCKFKPGDTCTTESDTGTVAPPSGGAKGEDTSGLPCAAGATRERIVTIAGGVQRKLCDYGTVRDVDASWSNNVASMLNAARGKVNLSGSGFRTADAQIDLRKKHCGTSQYDIYQKPAGSCRPPTARPGTSNHELGLAIDFQNCSYRSTACYVWLAGNAAQYGIKNLPSEPWHWSVDGG